MSDADYGKTTLRKLLKKKKFDFQGGTILHQPPTESYGGKSSFNYCDDKARPCIVVDPNAKNSILDEPFDSGFGGGAMPRFVAFDKGRILFPGVYDGSTWVEVVHTDMEFYLNGSRVTPYVGGG